MQAIVSMVLRNGLKLAGLAGVLSDSQFNEVVGAVSLLAGLSWSLFNAWRERRVSTPVE